MAWSRTHVLVTEARNKEKNQRRVLQPAAATPPMPSCSSPGEPATQQKRLCFCVVSVPLSGAFLTSRGEAALVVKSSVGPAGLSI